MVPARRLWLNLTSVLATDESPEAAPPSPPLPDALLSHGEKAYSAPGESPVTLTPNEDKLLQAIMKRGTADHATLARIDSNPSKTLSRLLAKHSAWGRYISLPGNKGAGGYSARIISAPLQAC